MGEHVILSRTFRRVPKQIEHAAGDAKPHVTHYFFHAHYFYHPDSGTDMEQMATDHRAMKNAMPVVSTLQWKVTVTRRAVDSACDNVGEGIQRNHGCMEGNAAGKQDDDADAAADADAEDQCTM
ncbi:hypothetical protein FKW77_000242 [Venturia effusa]|uniref:Uncharacterized protein n=1 Tax=Venturia effusa TaxID=50376 RepID=A0A517LM08_9PEZI|nr:hypothetical protein FKW77_000242 [Venturia effusa]